MTRHISLILLTIGLLTQAIAQVTTTSDKRPNRDPDSTRIVTSDIALFWQVFDSARPENDLIVFRDQYLRKGSIGLKEFTRTRISNSCALVDVIEKHPKYYASMRAASLKVDSYIGSIRASFRKLKEVYDDAVFPDVYFLIGRMNSAGTVSEAGLLIGVDMFGKTDNLPLEELSDWHKAVIKSMDRLPLIVAHELIHFQQKYPSGEMTLLQQSIKEGSADFIAEMIAGHHINENLHLYGDPREKELWLEFRNEMNGTDMTKWLYQGDKSKDRPADLGYYIGYKISRAYYERTADKKQAIKDILEIKDFQGFLKASRYSDRIMANSAGQPDRFR